MQTVSEIGGPTINVNIIWKADSNVELEQRERLNVYWQHKNKMESNKYSAFRQV